MPAAGLGARNYLMSSARGSASSSARQALRTPARRYRGTEKRQMAREISLAAVEADDVLAQTLVADQTSVGTRVARREEEAALQAALNRLPDRIRAMPFFGDITKIAVLT